MPGRAADPLASRADGLDWSIAMARAQGGDRDAYRQLLEGITPTFGRLRQTTPGIVMTLRTRFRMCC